MKKYPRTSTIEIDCDPCTGMGRQQNHYEAICKLLNVKPEPRISAFFGCWEWPITYKTAEDEAKAKEFLPDLYNSGLCRYASW